MFKVAMIDTVTGNRKIYATCPTSRDALAIQRHMNALNTEAAKLTGNAIRFFYMVLRSR